MRKLIDLLENKNIALVGNYIPEYEGVENGKEIDSFDIVLRFNNYRKPGKEIYTGLRTDVWFCNMFADINFDYYLSLDHNLRIASCPHYSDTHIKNLIYSYQGAASHSLDHNIITKKEYEMFHFPITAQFLKSVEDELKGNPTSGIIIFNWIIYHVKFKELKLFNYSLEGERPPHNLSNELKFIKKYQNFIKYDKHIEKVLEK